MSASGRQPTAFSRPIVERRADAERALKRPLGSTLQIPQISEFGPLISDFGPRISYFALPISSFRPPISDLGPPISAPGPQPSDRSLPITEFLQKLSVFTLKSDLGPQPLDLRTCKTRAKCGAN